MLKQISYKPRVILITQGGIFFCIKSCLHVLPIWQLKINKKFPFFSQNYFLGADTRKEGNYFPGVKKVIILSGGRCAENSYFPRFYPWKVITIPG